MIYDSDDYDRQQAEWAYEYWLDERDRLQELNSLETGYSHFSADEEF